MKKSKKIMSIALASGILMSSVVGSAMSDIKGSWAEDYITRLSDKGIITGYTDGTFRPKNNITREEAGAIVSRLFSEEEVQGSNNSLPDMGGRWSEKQIGFLVNKGIITGTPEGTFEPTRNITRAEFATIVYRYLESEDLFTEGKRDREFDDVKGNWAEEYILGVAKEGYINGYPLGGFRPNNDITRAEVSAIIALMDEAQESTEEETNGDIEFNQKVVNSLTELPGGQDVIYENKADGVRVRTDAENIRDLESFGQNTFKIQKFSPDDYVYYTKINLADTNHFFYDMDASYQCRVLSHDELNYETSYKGEEYYKPDDAWYSDKGGRSGEIFNITTDALDPNSRKRYITLREGDVLTVEIALTDNTSGHTSKFYVDMLVHELGDRALLPPRTNWDQSLGQ